MKLNLGWDSEARFGQDFWVKCGRNADVWLIFWRWNLSRFVKELVTLVSRIQPSGPLCLWQCLNIIQWPSFFDTISHNDDGGDKGDVMYTTLKWKCDWQWLDC